MKIILFWENKESPCAPLRSATVASMATRKKSIRERAVDWFIVLLAGDASGATSSGRGIYAASDQEQEGPLTQQEYDKKRKKSNSKPKKTD